MSQVVDVDAVVLTHVLCLCASDTGQVSGKSAKFPTSVGRTTSQAPRPWDFVQQIVREQQPTVEGYFEIAEVQAWDHAN